MANVHLFDPEYAAKYGLVEAIMIQNVQYWVQNNIDNEKNFRDGRTWSYNTIKAFVNQYPYLSEHQIRRAIDSLVTQGVLLKGNFNQSTYNRTTWYAFVDESMFVKRQVHTQKMANGSAKSNKTDTDVLPIDNQRNTSVSKADPANQCPVEKIIEVYHETLPELPKARLMTAKREKGLKKVWSWVMTSSKADKTRRAETPEQALQWFRQYFTRVRDNDFLMGRGIRSAEHRGWKCTIDFLMTDRGMTHVIENTGSGQ